MTTTPTVDGNLWRGVAFAAPLALTLWAGIAWIFAALFGSQTATNLAFDLTLIAGCLYAVLAAAVIAQACKR